jgi:small-conductance mechanosensitive channel
VAAQEVIGSIVSGIALVLDPEVNVGDYIKWQDSEGVVQAIALRVTRVETPDGELVTIPNTILTTHEIVRPFGRGNHRVIQELGLSYDEDIDEARAHLVRIAESLEGILDEPVPAAYVDELGGDDVVIRVHYWIHDPDRRDIFAIRSAYASAVKRHFEEEGIAISPPSEHAIEGHLDVDQSS